MLKNSFNIKFHPLYYALAMICLFTGYAKYFMICSIFIFIHEIGHITGGLLCHWNIKEVIFYPLGGMTVFDENLNRPILEEFIILILGPLFQISFYFFLCSLFSPPSIISVIHYLLLFFNLLPIYPLDGSKLCHLFWEKFLSFSTSYQVTLLFSYVTTIFLLMYSCYYRNLMFFLCLLLLIPKGIRLQKMLPYLKRRFCLERYMYNFSFPKQKIIHKSSQMKRDYKHLFLTTNGYETEKQILRKMFDLKENL